jgi:hypothetical protein
MRADGAGPSRQRLLDERGGKVKVILPAAPLIRAPLESPGV